MSLKQRIAEDTKVAMKARDQKVVSVLRMVRAKVLEREVELRSSKGRDYELNDDETTAVISAYAKQRRQSIESFREADRADLVAREQEELSVVEAYLPRQLSEEEIRRIVVETIEELAADGPPAMGLVMKAVMSRLKGAADGRIVNAVVKQELTS